MDEIQIQSSESQNSSCSVLTYEGTDGYISDGEDPFFIHPPSDQEQQPQMEMILEQEDIEQQIDDRDSINSKSKDQIVDYQQLRIKRQKDMQYKQIMDELKYGRNTTLLLNKNPAIPTYQQIMKIIDEIKKKYPNRSLQTIISKLHYILIQKKKEEQRLQLLNLPTRYNINIPQEKQRKQQWLRKRRIAAQTFVQLGYGVMKMRKFVEQNAINISITVQTYDQIIKKLLFDAYHRLERFLRKKCHKKIRAIKNQTEEKFLFQALRHCKRTLDTFEMHNFYKLIKLTYMPNQQFKISKRIASRLYHTCQQYVSRRKVKQGLLNPNDAQCEIYNDDIKSWSQQMIQMAVDLYIKEGSLNRVRQIMINSYGIQQDLVDNRSIKLNLQLKMKLGIDMLKQSLNKMKEQEKSKFRQLMDINESRMKWIMTQLQATNVRVVLCQVYKAGNSIALALIKRAILTINEYILSKQKHQMQQQINRTQKQYDPHQNQFKKRRRTKKYPS